MLVKTFKNLNAIKSKDKFIEVGEFYQELNDILGLEFPLKTIYRSKGFPKHLVKKGHYNCLKHIDDISDIIKKPDYIGLFYTIKKLLKFQQLFYISIFEAANYLSIIHDATILFKWTNGYNIFTAYSNKMLRLI